MAKGISIHVGINEVNIESLQENHKTLVGAENGAKEMCRIAYDTGFDPHLLLGNLALKSRFLHRIRRAALVLDTNDILFISICTHGIQKDIPAEKRDEYPHETDGKMESIILYDDELDDAELHQYWELFKPGVRIFLLIDSCHGGGMPPLFQHLPKDEAEGKLTRVLSKNDHIRHTNIQTTTTSLIDSVQTNEHNDTLIQAIEKPWVPHLICKRVSSLKPRIICISSSVESKSAPDANAHEENPRSPFIKAVIAVWNNGNYTRNYWQFYKDVASTLENSNQQKYPIIAPCPDYAVLGSSIGNTLTTFEQEIPFTII